MELYQFNKLGLEHGAPIKYERKDPADVRIWKMGWCGRLIEDLPSEYQSEHEKPPYLEISHSQK